jgi:hypothetical protein
MNPDGTINWIYILSVLFIRFVGVFIVLAILQIGINLSGMIINRLISLKNDKSADKTRAAS